MSKDFWKVIALALVIFIPVFAGIGVAQASLLTPSGAGGGGTLTPSIFAIQGQQAFQNLGTSLKLPSLAGVGTRCVNASSLGVLGVSTADCGIGSGGFPFTPTSWGVSTSTIVGFTQGLIASASSTINGGLHLGTPLETTSGGTGLSSYTLGDILYASGANTLATLAGNTTATPLYLSMTGTGSAAAAPSWQPIPLVGSKAYYAYATQATSSSAYFNMNPTASSTSTTVPYVLAATTQSVQNWISPVGDPGVTGIPGGTYAVDLFAWRSSGSASITLAVEVWEVSSTGADISLIGITNSTPNLTNAKAQYNLAFTTGQHTMSSTGSRILMRVKATAAGTPTLSLAMGDGDQMDLTTPGATVDVTNFVPYTGATQNLNLGAFNASTTQLGVSGNTYLTGLSTSQLLYTGTGGLVQNVATSTLTLGLGLTGTTVAVGSSNTLNIATSSLYTGTVNQYPVFTGTNILGATSTINVLSGGTGSTTSLGGILAGSGFGPIKSVVIGTNLTFDGTTLNATGGVTYPFTTLTNWATTTAATTTALQAPAFFASSTLASQFPQASTTQLTVAGGRNQVAVTFGSTTSALTSSTLVQFANQDGANSDWSFKVAGTGFGTINFGQSAGTLEAPATTSATNSIGSIQAYGYADGAYQTVGKIEFNAGTFGVASYPSNAIIQVTKTGDSAPYTLLTLDGDAGVSITDKTSAFSATFGTSALTANRTISFPNLTGTLALGSYSTGFTAGSIPFGSSGLLATSSALSFSSTNSNLAFTYGSTTALTVSGTAYIGSGTGLLLTTTGTVSNYAGATCTNQFVRSLSASGSATCATVGASDVSLANLSATDSTLTFSGTYNGSTARTIGLNLAKANTWTGLQTFNIGAGLPGIVTNSLVGIGTTTPKWALTIASSTGPQIALTDASLTSNPWTLRSISNGLYIATASPSTYATSTSWSAFFDPNGKFWIRDVLNGVVGIVNGTHGLPSYVATSTATFTGTSTPGVDATPETPMYFGGTITGVRCKLNTFLGVTIKINGTPVTPSYFVGSSTVGHELITGSNTYNAGDYVSVDYGTTTSATASSGVVRGGCTLELIQTI